MYDVIIVGAGPAGLFAADRLSKQELNILVIDERGYAGGSAINDGKLNLTHKIGMYFDELQIGEDKADQLIGSIDEKLLMLGANNTLYGTDTFAIERWIENASSQNIELVPATQRHLGTDKAKEVWENFYNDLSKRGVNFLLGKRVESIHKGDECFEIRDGMNLYKSKYLLVSPGRGGSYWFREQTRRLGVATKYGPIDIGIRIEIPFEVYQPITDIIYDPKFILVTKSHGDKVRTFCTNPRGFVKIEPRENAVSYNGGVAYSLNGDAYRSRQSNNTNFAILHTIVLTEPDEDTTEFGRNSVVSCYTLGGGKPLVQRLGDLLDGKRSKESTFNKCSLKPTLDVPKKATPGDIALAYNGRTVDNLKEMLLALNAILPGVANPETIVWAPEVKFYDTKYQTENMQTTVPGLFVAGDGSGKSRGIVGAAVTGILAAEGILDIM